MDPISPKHHRPHSGVLALAASIGVLLASSLGNFGCAPAAAPKASNAAEAAEAISSPNIFIYIADDQILSSIGCYGAEPSLTPNVDRLASEGMRFTNAFAASSICTPNRGTLLTGMYPLRNGAHANHSGFHDGIKSLPNYMKELGYRACLGGKDGIQQASDLYHWETKIEKSEEHVPGADEPKHDRHRKSDLPAIEKFLADNSDGRPFCYVHAASLPHGPYLNTLPNGLEGYDASNWYGDYEFGELLEILDRNGLTENTVVIYVNDNEAGTPGTKYNLYEASLRVPMIVRWPGRVRPGSINEAFVSFLDIMPTLMEVAKGEAPPTMDGKSLIALLDEQPAVLHEELYASYTGVIVGGGKRLETPYPIRSIRNARYKYIRNLNYTVPHPKQTNDTALRPAEELYDLASDPDEKTNRAEDPELVGVKKELSEKLDAWMTACGDKGIESELEALQKYPPGKGKSKVEDD